MYPRIVRKKKSPWQKRIVTLAVCGLVIVLGISLIKSVWPTEALHTAGHLSAQIIHSTPTPTPTPPAFVPLDMQARWQKVLDKYPTVTVGIELRDIDTGLVAGVNQQEAFRAASTGKLVAASYFMHQVEAGVYALNDPMAGYTTKFHLQQMINQSNNNSWEAFLKLLGRTNEENFAHSQGWNSFVIATNYLSPDDLADLLQKLWNGKLMNTEHTNYVLSLMQDTNDESWIPPAIPSGATVYHKYGALEDDIHDASIIKTANGRVFSLVIMTNGNGVYAYDARAELFHQLVQATFE